jgi:hypothetical protein
LSDVPIAVYVMHPESLLHQILDEDVIITNAYLMLKSLKLLARSKYLLTPRLNIRNNRLSHLVDSPAIDVSRVLLQLIVILEVKVLNDALKHLVTYLVFFV